MHRRLIAMLLGVAFAGQLMGQVPAAHSATVANQKTACAYTQHSISGLNRFSAMIGRTVDCAIVFSDTTGTWADWQQPWVVGGNDVDTQWADWYRAVPGRTLVVTQSLVPEGIESNWRALGAAGAYDDHIRAWATAMVSAGLGTTIIRLGHEANGDWYFDNVGSTPQDYANWAAYWARFVRVARTVPGAAFTFDWTVNAGYRRIPFDSYYPGDDVVDVIGIDQYDGVAYAPNPLPTTPAARWSAILAQKWGLGDLMAYAAAHGKPLSLPEWGLMTAGSSGGTGGGDDGNYVDQIAAVIRTNNVRYAGVWEMNDPTASTALENNPAALAAYKTHFGAGGDSLGLAGLTAPGSTGGGATPPAPTSSTPTPAPSSGHASPLARAVATRIAARLTARAAGAARRVQIVGTLTSSGHPVPSARLSVERLVRHRWVTVTRLRSSGAGRVVWAGTVKVTTTYRLRYAATAGRAASRSPALTVVVRR